MIEWLYFFYSADRKIAGLLRQGVCPKVEVGNCCSSEGREEGEKKKAGRWVWGATRGDTMMTTMTMKTTLPLPLWPAVSE